MKLTDDYFVTISEVNGRPTLSRSNMLNELWWIRLQKDIIKRQY
jgi:hypothetical protein